MIPVLYDAGEKDFTSNGLGRLYDAIFCTVTEERNGSFELEMTYPVSGIHYKDILKETEDANGVLRLSGIIGASNSPKLQMNLTLD